MPSERRVSTRRRLDKIMHGCKRERGREPELSMIPFVANLFFSCEREENKTLVQTVERALKHRRFTSVTEGQDPKKPTRIIIFVRHSFIVDDVLFQGAAEFVDRRKGTTEITPCLLPFSLRPFFHSLTTFWTALYFSLSLSVSPRFRCSIVLSYCRLDDMNDKSDREKGGV